MLHGRGDHVVVRPQPPLHGEVQGFGDVRRKNDPLDVAHPEEFREGAPRAENHRVRLKSPLIRSLTGYAARPATGDFPREQEIHLWQANPNSDGGVP